MNATAVPAPGRPIHGRPGAVLLILLTFTVCACEGPAPERPADREVLILERDTVPLAEGAAVVEVRLRSDRGSSMIEPDTVRARPGDVVRFIAADAKNYAIAFEAEALSVEARTYLERTAQLRSAPLIAPGASWIVSLEGAPPGAYPFTCVAHGARGLLIVQAARAAPSS